MKPIQVNNSVSLCFASIYQTSSKVPHSPRASGMLNWDAQSYQPWPSSSSCVQRLFISFSLRLQFPANVIKIGRHQIPLAASPVFNPMYAPEIGIATWFLTSGLVLVWFFLNPLSCSICSWPGGVKFCATWNRTPSQLNLRADLER